MAEGQANGQRLAFDFAQVGQQQLDALVATQREFLERVEEANQLLAKRAQSEATLMMDFMSKLSTARSLPEAAAVWQECMSRQVEMMAEDGQRFLDRSNKALKANARLFQNGGAGFGN